MRPTGVFRSVAWFAVLLAGRAAILVASMASPASACEDARDDAPAQPRDVALALEGDPSPFAATVTGEAKERDGAPKFVDGHLYLLPSWWKSTASVAFAAPGTGPVAFLEAAWTLVLNTGSEGMGFAWLDTSRFGTEGAAPEVEEWEAPSLAGSLGVGFDALDPPNRDPFRGSGNVYDRPQHLVSLHYDGFELVKRRTTTEFRDEKPHAVTVRFEFVTGGALATVRIDDEVVFDRTFLPAAVPYAGRPAFGARNGETAGDVLIAEPRVKLGPAVEAPDAPLVITALDNALNDKDHARNVAEIEFPADTARYGRILCFLGLDKPPTRFDPWDRLAGIHVLGDDGKPVELVRYITPYHRGHQWRVDVSDFRPLLRGKRRIQQTCSTQDGGWLVSVRFEFWPGPTDRLAYRVEPLWSGDAVIGDPEHPATEFYRPRSIPLDDDAAFAKVCLVVTGHGMLPNTGNAGEFLPLGRTLTVNGKAFHDVLWKDDNDLNPCRPQGGTWKYDRAGWAPGDVVRPWEVDVSDLLPGARELFVDYALDPYVNDARGQTWAPFHKTAGFLVLYRKP